VHLNDGWILFQAMVFLIDKLIAFLNNINNFITLILIQKTWSFI